MIKEGGYPLKAGESPNPFRRPQVTLDATDEREYLALRERVNNALHHLWTRYTHTPGYDKSEWRELANAISALEFVARKTTERL